MAYGYNVLNYSVFRRSFRTVNLCLWLGSRSNSGKVYSDIF